MHIISWDSEVPKSDLTPLDIRWIKTEPIVQWWMWVGISIAELAWAVAREWGIWTLSSVWLCLTPRYKHIYREYIERARINKRLKWWSNKLTPEEKSEAFRVANLQCLRLEIRKAKQISEWKWQIWLNVMVAMDDYESHVRVACEEWINGIVSGAGLPKKLPEYTKDYPGVSLIPILSEARWTSTIIKHWWRHYGRLPDAFVLEDPSTAGWHLWAIWGRPENVDHPDTLLKNSIPAAQKIIFDMLSKIRETDPNKDIPLTIPIIAAWWIVDRSDLDKILVLWANAGQLWSRFLASTESNASEHFKQAILDAIKPSDIVVYRSSTWLPARALSVSWTFVWAEEVEIKTRVCVRNCLWEDKCGYRNENNMVWKFAEWDRPLLRCIANDLVNSTAGNGPKAMERDLLFVWGTVLRIDQILWVEEIMNWLKIPVDK